MRWFVGSAVGIVLLWGLYIASPYWAVLDFARAVDSRNVQTIGERVNFRALRLSLAKQLVTEGMASRAVATALTGSDAQVAAGTIAAAVDPLLEQLLTVEGVVGLLPKPGAEGSGGVSGGGDRSVMALLRDTADLVRTSRWRGFRNIYFALPPNPGTEPQARLQFRLGRLKWRLVGVELTPETRQRLLAETIRLYRPPAR
jgi:hypothetical protein